jgi:voltage-gated potassium channel
VADPPPHDLLRPPAPALPRAPAHARVPARLVRAAVLGVTIVVVGTVGYRGLAHRAGVDTTWLDALYMTVTTITTVGYGEIVDVGRIPGGRAFGLLVVLGGVGNFLYLVSALTAFIVEGDLGEIRRRRKMQAKIDALSGHFIVCGVGKTGVHVAEELLATRRPFVLVDQSVAAIAAFAEMGGAAARDALHVLGDGTEEHVLQQAGIARAAGLVAALSSDKDNLFVVITARELNPSVRIISRAIEPNAAGKLRKAGATDVVETNRIGGQRMVSAMVRPRVVEFLDLMLRDRDRNMRVEEIDVAAGSPLDGREIRDADLRRHGAVLVVAVFSRAEGKYHYAPGPEYRLRAGESLILLGDVPTVTAIRQALSSGTGNA